MQINCVIVARVCCVRPGLLAEWVAIDYLGAANNHRIKRCWVANSAVYGFFPLSARLVKANCECGATRGLEAIGMARNLF
jgi:hypothetical protein